MADEGEERVKDGGAYHSNPWIFVLRKTGFTEMGIRVRDRF